MSGRGIDSEAVRNVSASVLTHWEGEPVQVWERLWGIPRLEAHDRLTSSNDRARRLALEGAERFTTVIAEEQTAGRGRSGRRWDSPPGQGLWMSTIVSGAGERFPALTPILVGIALIRAIRAVMPEAQPGLKWPNDVQLEGRKVAGVLCGSVGDGRGVVAGIGVNVRQSERDFPQELRETAGSLQMVGRRSVTRARLAGQVMRELMSLLTTPPLRLEGALATEIEAVDALAGRTVRVSTGVEGTAEGFGSDGRLRVRDGEGQTHRIRAGSVRLV